MSDLDDAKLIATTTSMDVAYGDHHKLIGRLAAEIERLRAVRDSWCAAYTEARDQRDALKVALGRCRTEAENNTGIPLRALILDICDAIAAVPAADV